MVKHEISVMLTSKRLQLSGDCDVFAKALSKDERAAILADIEEEKQRKMQVQMTHVRQVLGFMIANKIPFAWQTKPELVSTFP